MRVDYHTHHYRCGHARGQLKDYVEAAIAARMDEIGMSDHSPIYHLGPDPHVRPQTAMSQEELPNYVREMQSVREQYEGRIRVRLGVESDYILGYDDHYRKLWQSYPLDYAIGSVHWLGDWSIFSRTLPEGRTAMAVYEEYLEWTQALARSGAYDIIGHLDCIKTQGWLPTRDITRKLEETLQVIAESDIAIELNVSGWRKRISECYPRRELLARCCEYGIPVTFGSDAHDPDLVGYQYEKGMRLLYDVGYRQIATFENRQRTMVPIDLD